METHFPALDAARVELALDRLITDLRLFGRATDAMARANREASAAVIAHAKRQLVGCIRQIRQRCGELRTARIYPQVQARKELKRRVRPWLTGVVIAALGTWMLLHRRQVLGRETG